MSESLYDKALGESIANAKVFKKRPFFPNEGVHTVMIESAKIIKNRIGILHVIIEGTILKSTLPNKAGMQCSQVIAMKNDAAPGNVKNFIAAAIGIDPDEVTPDHSAYILGGENPLEKADPKIQLKLTTFDKEKQKTEGVFTVHDWAHLSEDEYLPVE